MTREFKEGGYTDDEIEQILGMGLPETKLLLKEVRQTIDDNALLVAGLAFAFGILVGLGLGNSRRRSC